MSANVYLANTSCIDHDNVPRVTWTYLHHTHTLIPFHKINPLFNPKSLKNKL